MITKEMIERINFLARKQKSEGLTSAEKSEQDKLRRQYVDSFKNNLRAQLECIKSSDEDKTEHPSSCGCGCGHKHDH